MNEKFTHEDRKTGIRNTVIVLLCIILVFLGLVVNRVLQPRILSVKEMVNSGAIMFSTPREISPFELVDQNGESFSKEQLLGKWTFVFFGFTHCPDICPITLSLFNSLAKNLEGSEFFDSTEFLFVTLDPARDDPATIKKYIEYFNPNFNGIGGDFLTVFRFARELNIAFQKVVTNAETGDYSVDHSGNVVLINPQGHYHGFYKPPLDESKMALTYKSIRMQHQ
jgi:protein SCO1/2